MKLIEAINDIQLFQWIAMIVATSLAIVMLLIKVPHSEHVKKLTRAKNAVALSYLICAFTFGYTLYHGDIPDYEVFSALTMLILVAFSTTTLAFSLINLLSHRYIEFSRLLISIFAVFIISIILIETFFYGKDNLFNIALVFGIVLFCAQCIYYIIIFDKWYKKSILLLEKYYDEDEEHKLKWIKFCFILAMLTDMFILVYLLLPKGMMIVYIGFYILFLLYFASNFISFIGSHKLLLDAFGHWTISKGGKRSKKRKAARKTPAEVAGQNPGDNGYGEIEKALERWVREKKFREYDKSREEIAAELGTTKEVLHQYFSVEKGIDFRTWRTELRIEEAKKLLLKDRKLSINLVGEMAGFSDRSNFHRQFTRIVGCSPREWRESGGSGTVNSGSQA